MGVGVKTTKPHHRINCEQSHPTPLNIRNKTKKENQRTEDRKHITPKATREQTTQNQHASTPSMFLFLWNFIPQNEVLPRLCPSGATKAKRLPKRAKRLPRDANSHLETPNGQQAGPNKDPREPKRHQAAPKRPKQVPRDPQGGAKSRHKSPQDGPRRSQESPKRRPEPKPMKNNHTVSIF